MKCKHDWQAVKINPYLALPLEDSWGIKAEFVCVCLKCNKFKTIDAERITEQTKEFTYDKGCEPPGISQKEDTKKNDK